MKKKGSLSASMLVSILILLTGFVIILYFLLGFIQDPLVDREVCHQSVIFRGTLPNIAKEYVPLKCKEAKYCITTGLIAGECEDFAGEEEVTKVRVSNVEEIEQFLAREVLDCWETMGEGKVPLIGDWITSTFGFGKLESSCTICSRVAFDKNSLEKKKIDIGKVDLFEYMITHKPPNKDKSYIEHIGRSGKVSLSELNKKSLKKSLSVLEDEGLAEDGIGVEEVHETGKNDQLAVMFMQVHAVGQWEGLKNAVEAAAGATAGSSFVLGVGTTARLVFSKVTMVSAVLGLTAQQLNIAINRGVAAGYCGDVIVGEGAEKGCSVVRVTGYDADSISNYCSVIESIP